MIRVAIIGSGFMGNMHANVYGLLSDAKLVGIVDNDINRGNVMAESKGVKAFTSLEELLDNVKEVDLIDICTPTFLHHEYVIKAAKAGKHIMCEKPMAMNLEEADEMVVAAKEAGVKFMVGHCIRFWPEYQVLKDYVDNERLGKLRSLWFSRLSPCPTWSWNNWLLDQKKSEGALLDLHIHDVDYLNYLLGKPTFLYSQGFRNSGGWNHVFTSFGYQGKAVLVEGSWAMPPNFPFSMSYRAVFDDGVLDFASDRSTTLLAYENDKEPHIIDLPKSNVSAKNVGGNISDIVAYYNELSYYIDCLMKDEYPKVITPESARDSLALIFAEKESLETGQMIFL